MQHFKDYTGSVYGGLGHLLYAYCQASGLPNFAEQLEKAQNLERFDYALWLEVTE